MAPGVVVAQDRVTDLPLTIAQRFMEAAFPDLKETKATVFATVATSFAADFVNGGLLIFRVNPKATDVEPFLNATVDVALGVVHQAWREVRGGSA